MVRESYSTISGQIINEWSSKSDFFLAEVHFLGF